LFNLKLMSVVSIITPVYNSEKYISENIRSVQAQTYDNWEHILVDDCSSDSSEIIIKSFQKKDARIKYFRLEENSGAGVARNKAIELASGKYIAFLDSDDLWHSEKLARQVAFMEEHDYHFTFTGYEVIDHEGRPTGKCLPAKEKVTYKSALYKNPIGCLTAMYSVDYYDKEYMPTIRKRQDYALWLKLLKKSDAHGLNESLASYRTGNQSISSNKLNLIKYEWKIYREIERLSLTKSTFYLISAILIKLKSYF